MIDRVVLRKAKEVARRSGVTLSSYINEALVRDSTVSRNSALLRSASVRYEADDGPLSEQQLRAIRKMVPQKMVVVRSLFPDLEVLTKAGKGRLRKGGRSIAVR